MLDKLKENMIRKYENSKIVDEWENNNFTYIVSENIDDENNLGYIFMCYFQDDDTKMVSVSDIYDFEWDRKLNREEVEDRFYNIVAGAVIDKYEKVEVYYSEIRKIKREI